MYVIINADDFGYSKGINRGIIEAHINGVVTSTSVMVDAVAAGEAKELSVFDNLSIGLHFVSNETDDFSVELERQFNKFIEIVGRKPDHLDTHKRQTTEEGLKAILQDFSAAHMIPVRNFNARHIRSFGVASGDSSLDQLKRSIDEATDKYNELMTHVGYSDDYLRRHSSYNDMREDELKSICSFEIKQYIKERGVTLINWRGVPS